MDVRKTLDSVGVVISHDHGMELACFCPFHDNSHSPALFINKKTGLWHCFNPECAKRGSLARLVRLVSGGEYKIDYSPDDLSRMLDELDAPEEKKVEWGDVLERISINWDDPADVQRLSYLLERGFSVPTLKHFEVCFSEARNRVVLPVRDEQFKVVGLIGRSVDGSEPKYKYSKGFHRASSLFNIQNAMQYDECIVVEGSLDALKVHQAGMPNVVATLGAQVTDRQIDILNRRFSKIVVFSDNDEAGNSMRAGIMDGVPKRDVRLVQYPEGCGFKDPGDMDDDTIRDFVTNSIDSLSWMLENIQM